MTQKEQIRSEIDRYIQYMYDGRYEKDSEVYNMLDKCARHFINFGRQIVKGTTADEPSDETQEIIAALATEDGECRAFKEAKANNAAYIIEDGWIVRVYADNRKEKIKYVGETTVKINNDEKLVGYFLDVIPKIKGWVAREGVSKIPYKYVYSHQLAFFKNKPKRCDGEWNGILGMYINSDLFPDLKWEDEPVEVELMINKI